MKNSIKKINLILVLVLLITACSPINPKPVSTATSTPIISTMTPTSTSTPVPTPTSTPITVEEQDELLQAYKIMVLIQVDVNLLDQLATKVNSGELSGLDAFASLIAAVGVTNAVDQAIPQTTVPLLMKPFWEKAIPIHESTKELLARWYNKEIASIDVLAETPALMKKIDKIMDDCELGLGLIYGFDINEMRKAREEAMNSLADIFATPTPQP